MQLVYRQRAAWDAFIKQASGAGFRVLKHGRWGSPHERQLRCALDTQQLTWGSKSDSMLALTAVTAVVAGKTTKVFAGVGDDDAPPSECLSFICTDRTLDLQLANEAERDHVLAMFQRLLKKLTK